MAEGYYLTKSLALAGLQLAIMRLVVDLRKMSFLLRVSLHATRQIYG
jgi:hypothetical protein